MKKFINAKFYNNETAKSMFVDSDGKIKGFDLNDKNKYEEIDLKGGYVYPGFHDAHLHLLALAEKMFYQVDLSGANSKEDVKIRVKNFIKDNKVEKGKWIIGLGWHQGFFKEKTMLNINDLDEISVDYPILLFRACFHIGCVNTKALEYIRPFPKKIEGGEIDFDSMGNPTGIIRETALDLFKEYIPRLNDKNEIKNLILKTLNIFAQKGLTTVWTDDFSYVEDKKVLLEAYKELDEEDLLPIRVRLQLRVENLKDLEFYEKNNLKAWSNYNKLGIASGKIIGDGALGAATAAMRKPYEKSNNTGIMIYDNEYLGKLINKAFEIGIDMAVHSIGDRTLETVLNIYEKNQKIILEKDFRPSIIHCQIGDKELYTKMKELNIAANVQPIFIQSDESIAEDRLGVDRLEESYAWRTLMDLGVLVYGSSDGPIEDVAPIPNIFTAVYRKDIGGKMEKPFIENQRISCEKAIEMFTVNAAKGAKYEEYLGKLEENYFADLVVTNKPLKDGIDWEQIRVKHTYIGGNKKW